MYAKNNFAICLYEIYYFFVLPSSNQFIYHSLHIYSTSVTLIKFGNKEMKKDRPVSIEFTVGNRNILVKVGFESYTRARGINLRVNL